MRRILSFGLISIVIILSCAAPVRAATVESRLDALERELKQMNETARFNNKRLAEALSIFEQVQEEIARLRGEIEKISHLSATDAKDRQAGLQGMEHRLARMDENLADLGLKIRELSAIEKPSDAKESPKKKAANLLYQEAFSELTQRNYKSAANRFEKFIKKYPKSSLADNAQYWRGECFFALGDFETAVLEYQKVIKRYPKGNKVPAAILKQGYAFVELKSYADAKAFFEKVILEYPRSEEAIRAREKLAEVNELLKAASSEKTS